VGLPEEGKGGDDEKVWARWRKWLAAVESRKSLKVTTSERGIIYRFIRGMRMMWPVGASKATGCSVKKTEGEKHDLEFLKREFDLEVLQGVKGMIYYFLGQKLVLMHP
jgi:hypothetical protein